VLRWLTERRRRHLLEAPLSPAWRELIEQRTPSFEILDAGERTRLAELVQVFVAEKRWEACGGLELTDEIRVTIAAMACVMLLGRDHDLFRDVASILVYPTAVKLPSAGVFVRNTPRRAVHAGTTSGVRLPDGPIVLAWDAVLDDATTLTDGANIVVHVLAHAIDTLDGIEDGTPPLPRAARAAWTSAMQSAFDAQREHASGFLREQAADSPAEYFAVAAESFFERPRQLASALPDVYDVLRAFFALDLAPRAGLEGAPYRS